MLYVTTRNERDAFTSARALREDRGPDGGFYVPVRLPSFSEEQIREMGSLTFGQCVSRVLNQLFPVDLTGWDIALYAGREPVRVAPVGHKVVVAELWHNARWDFSEVVKALTALLHPGGNNDLTVGHWARIAVRSACLFGIYGRMLRDGMLQDGQRMDVAVVSGDFSGPMACRYARDMGLPIGSILCCCNENKVPWDLLYQGSIKCGTVAVETGLPEADIAVPAQLERLLYACGGAGEAIKFADCLRRGRNYYPEEELLQRIKDGLYVSVIGNDRLWSTIPNVYRAHGYVLGPLSALAYAGTMDHRAKTGENRHCVILSDKGALCDEDAVARSMGMDTARLRRILE